MPAGRLTVQAEDIGTHDVMLDTADTLGGSGVQLLVLALPTQPDPFATVVYIVEARRRTTPYESNLAGDAVIIHALRAYGTTQSLDSDVPPATYSANEGSMLRPGERFRLPQGFERLEQPARAGGAEALRTRHVQASMSVSRAAFQAQPVVNEAFLRDVAELSRRMETQFGCAPARADGLLALRGVLDLRPDRGRGDSRVRRWRRPGSAGACACRPRGRPP